MTEPSADPRPAADEVVADPRPAGDEVVAEPRPAADEAAPFRADRVEEDIDRAVTAHREARGPWFQWPLVLVLVGLAISLLVVAGDHFRRGSVGFAACVVLAFFLRLILSDEDAGWLAVRSRLVDLLCLAFLGLSLSVFALIVPPPS